MLTRYGSDMKNPKEYRLLSTCECRIEAGVLVLQFPTSSNKRSEYLHRDPMELERWAKVLCDCIRALRLRKHSSAALLRSQSIRHCPGFDTLFDSLRTQKRQEIDVSDAADVGSILTNIKTAADPSLLALSKLRNSPLSNDLASSLDQIWMQYDTDGDGFLNPKENAALVRAYFKAKQKHTPGIIQDTIDATLGMYFKEAVDKSSMASFVCDIRKNAEEKVNTFYNNLESRITDVANEMWERMDCNRDGRVDRHEFMSVFLDCDEVLYFDSAMRTSIGDDVAAAVSVLLQKHNKTDLGTCGLKNIGNTCYMNTAIQCLSATVKFRQFFLSGTYSQYINTKNRLGTKGRLANAFAEMLTSMWKGGHAVFTPKHFKDELGKVDETFSGYGQEDCHELISCLLDRLHEDLNYITEKKYIELKDPPRATDEELANMWWEYHIKQNVGVVVSLFHGQLKSVVTCSKCRYVSKAFDAFMYLSVPVASSGSTTLASCLSGSLGVEEVKKDSDWYCGQCKKHQPFKKEVSIWRLPQYLIVHLKRFRYSVYGTISSKLGTAIDFPEVFSPEQWCERSLYDTVQTSSEGMYECFKEVITPAMPFLSPRAPCLASPLSPLGSPLGLPASRSPLGSRQTSLGFDGRLSGGGTSSSGASSSVSAPPGSYHLYGIANHYGSSSGGHYTAFAKVNDKWKAFDDSYVSDLVWSFF